MNKIMDDNFTFLKLKYTNVIHINELDKNIYLIEVLQDCKNIIEDGWYTIPVNRKLEHSEEYCIYFEKGHVILKVLDNLSENEYFCSLIKSVIYE